MKKIKAIAPCLLLACSMLSVVGCDKVSDIQSLTSNSQTPSENSNTTSQNQNRNVNTAAWQIPAAGFDTSKEVSIKFDTTMGKNLTPVLDEAIKDFNDIYPNIKITYTSGTGYDELKNNITTELSVGEGPDLAYCYADHVAAYNLTKKVVTLDNLIEDEELGLTTEQYSDFIEGYYNEGKSFGDGLMYTLPFSKSTEILYYNKTVFTEKGLSVPTHWFSNGANDTTSMEYVCEELKKIDPAKCIPLGYDSESNLFITMCEQLQTPYTSATGDHFVFNTTENKAFMKDFKEKLFDKGYLTTQKIYGNYTSGLFNAYKGSATTEQFSLMSIGSSAGASHQVPTKLDSGEYPFDVGVAPIPQYNANNAKAISQGPSVCIFNQGDDQKIIASWLLTRFLTTNVAFQAAFSMESGYVPVIKSVSDNDTYKAFTAKANDETADLADRTKSAAAKLCIEQESTYFTSPAFNGSSEARVQVGNLVQQYFSNAKTLDAAFSDAVAACNAAI